MAQSTAVSSPMRTRRRPRWVSLVLRVLGIVVVADYEMVIRP